MLDTPEIIVTAHDLQRLRALSVSPDLEDALEGLDQELWRARVVGEAEVPPDVVTMNSRILFEDLEAGVERELTLVYPDEADIDSKKVSVLAPMGTAVLGLRVGQTIEWPLPRNRSKRIRIVKVLFQPEAAGELPL